MTVGGVRSAYTSVAARSFEPQWNERFRVPVASHAVAVQFTVKVGCHTLPLSTSSCTTAVTSSLVSSCCTGPRGWLTAAELQETDALGSPHLGTATIPVSELLSGQVVTGWHVLKHRTGRGVSFGKASIRVTVQYVPVSKARALCAAMTSQAAVGLLALSSIVMVSDKC